MPCWTIETVKVRETLENLDRDLLKTALEQMGFQVWIGATGLIFKGMNRKFQGYQGAYNGVTFECQSPYGAIDINEVKRAYSAQVVENSAEQLGWICTKTAEGEYELEKPY